MYIWEKKHFSFQMYVRCNFVLFHFKLPIYIEQASIAILLLKRLSTKSQ